MGYQTNWTIASFFGIGIMCILAFYDLIVKLFEHCSKSGGYAKVAEVQLDVSGRPVVSVASPETDPYLRRFLYMITYLIAWALIAVTYGTLLDQTTSNSITTLANGARQANTILTLAVIAIAAITGGFAYAALRGDTKSYCLNCAVVLVSVLVYSAMFGFMISFLYLACAGTFATYALVAILAPLGDIGLFYMRWETKWIWISLIPRIMSVIGYVFLGLAINNMVV